MGNTDNYSFIKLDESNVQHLIYLYKQVFNIRYSLKYIKAKYLSSYCGIRAQGHFAFLNDRPVAFHGAIPVLMQYKNKFEHAAQYGDAMTLRSHTGKGLFTKLGKLTDQLLIDKQVKFIWGFPNQNSEYGYINKLDWQGSERMKCFIIKLNAIPYEMLIRKSKIFERYNQKRINRILDPFLVSKKDMESIDLLEYGGVYRSLEYYRYKSFTQNHFIQLDQTKVWIKPLGGLLVGDMEVKSEYEVLRTVQNLQILSKKLGLNKVVLQASPNSQLCQILQKEYTPIDSWLIGYKDFNSQFDLNKLQFTYGDLDTF